MERKPLSAEGHFLDAMGEATGKQLAVNVDRTSIDAILDKYLCYYYPKQFRFLLKERIENALMEQQKKFFKK